MYNPKITTIKGDGNVKITSQNLYVNKDYEKLFFNDKMRDWYEKNYDDVMKEQGRILLKMLKDKYGKKEENMLDKNQQEIIIDQFESKLKELTAKKGHYVRQIALYGTNLQKLIDEMDNIESVLSEMKPCDDCDD